MSKVGNFDKNRPYLASGTATSEAQNKRLGEDISTANLQVGRQEEKAKTRVMTAVAQ